MSDHAYALASAFKACGQDAEVMEESDDLSVYWGRKYTTGKECYPCVLTTGDMVKVLKKHDFNPDKSAFLMPSGDGPCRFGQYNRFHRMVLDELGFENVPIYAPNQDHRLYNDFNIVGKQFSRLAWRAVVATDLLTKLLHQVRPYERNKGEAEDIYKQSHRKIMMAIESADDGLIPTLKDSLEKLLKVEKVSKKKPVIGVVGEIYVRSNRFSNSNIISKIEEFGGQVWLAPVCEWISYVNFISNHRQSKQKPSLQDKLGIILMQYIQNKDEHIMEELFGNNLDYGKEPKIKVILDKASTYIHVSFEGEAILSVGKSVDFIEKGVSGIVNVMPFTCMPGTISSAIMRLLQKKYNVPIINIAYDGQGLTNINARLEAFMYQVREHHLVKYNG
jgi:predicted nucleotide-binding protein (sugar kinase/HSP70/actin superfamily)